MSCCNSKSASRDGTPHIKMSPLEFMRGMAAQVLRPRLHLICVHGVMAPNAGLHAAICRARRRIQATLRTNPRTARRRECAGRGCSNAFSISTSNTARNVAET